MRRHAAAFAGIVIRLSSPARYGNAGETSTEKTAMLFRLSRGRRGARRLTRWMRPDPGRYRYHQDGDKENDVQERPEINLLIAQVPHSPRIENCQTKGPRHDRQLAPPTEQ